MIPAGIVTTLLSNGVLAVVGSASTFFINLTSPSGATISDAQSLMGVN